MGLNFELRLILAILTCYRLARLIAKDDGPLFLFEHIRQSVRGRADTEGYNLGRWHSLAEGLECPYCLGVWFSLPILALLVWPSYYGDLFLLLMAISGAQAFLWGLVSK